MAKDTGRDKLFDPEFLKAFTEAIHKDKKLRVKWGQAHGSLLQRGSESCEWDDEPDDDDIDFVEPDKKTLETASQSEGDDDPSQKRMSKLKTMIAASKDIAGEDVEDQLQVMRPVPLEVKKLLYKGLSRDNQGARKYLRHRYKVDPEDKFYFPILSSFEYGWTYGQPPELKFPEHGRTEIIKTSFYRANNPQINPTE